MKTIYNGKAVRYGTSGYFEYELPAERPESRLSIALGLVSTTIVLTVLYILVGA